jgi:uncharacterized membrane protein
MEKEEIKGQIKERVDEFNKKVDERAEKKKRVKVFGVSMWRILSYMVIYSFLGYLVEVLYGLITKGVIESRQSFLYGPFCAIYGFGAICMILPLKKINSSNRITTFLISGVIGCIVEYLVSWFGETFMHVKWWDYSSYFLNINGRVCLYFGIFWGILGLLLMEIINPRVDAIIDVVKEKTSLRKQYALVILTNLFLVIDCAATIVATDFYQTRVIHDNDIDVRFKDYYEDHYQDIYGNEKVKNRIEVTWGNDFMIKTFPNLKIVNTSGETIYLNSFYPNIQNYYVKVFDSEVANLVDGN